MNAGPRRRSLRPAGQRGVVLLFALIALLILMIGAAALIRSFNTSLFMAGNIGFKRDLQNQGERAVALALTAFNGSGGLATPAARAASTTTNDTLAINYSAQILSVDAQGIPDVLTRADGTDQTAGTTFVLNTNYDRSYPGQISIRFVVDRLCASAGNERTLGAAQCALATARPTGNGGSSEQNSDSLALGAGLTSSAAQFVLYRLSARITGPRQTQSFFQSTFSVPS